MSDNRSNQTGVLPAAYSPPILAEICRRCNIAGDFPLLADIAGKIAADAELADYARALYKEFAEAKTWNSFANHYSPTEKLGRNANAIFFLTALSAMPTAEERYRAQGTPEEMIAETLDFSQHGTSGENPVIKFSPVQLSFFRNFYHAIMYRIGRFQFKLHRDKRDLPAVLTHKANPAQKVLLAADQTFYDDSGFMAGENAAWIARTSITDQSITGHIIQANGTVGRTQERFSLTEWSLEYGVREVIDMHIPGGGGMTPELSRASLQKAFDFFSGKCRVIYCNSWIFNPDLQNLAGTKNITELMKMGHLFPVKSTGKDGMFFLFGSENTELADLPRKSSLQRSVIDFMQRGGKLRSGGIFFFADEV